MNMALKKIIRAAVKHFHENGYTSARELAEWQAKIRAAAELRPEAELVAMVTDNLEKAFTLEVDREKVLKRHAGISRFTLAGVRPDLRAELDKRILAAANLIKLNRTKSIELTLSRFSGWATSIPDKRFQKTPVQLDLFKEVNHIWKPANQTTYEARRVMIDQNHKLLANIDNIISVANGAIAAVWHSHWRQPNYDFRDKHKLRDEKVYFIRGNWAYKAGYAKKGAAGYLDSVTQPGEEVFCIPGNVELELAHQVSEATRHWYEGELVEVTTSDGKTLRITPNHPILTPRGWLPAEKVKEGVFSFAVRRPESRAKRFSTMELAYIVMDGVGRRESRTGTETCLHGDASGNRLDLARVAHPVNFGRRLRKSLPPAPPAAGGPLVDYALFELGEGDAQQGAEVLSGYDAHIEPVKITSVRRVPFAGWVYNLTTERGWYAAGGLIVHNCRCYLTYLYNLRSLPDEMLTKKGREFLNNNPKGGKR